MFKSDIEIARKANTISIQKVGSKLGLEEEHLLPYGNDKAKISEKFIKSVQKNKNGKLILLDEQGENLTSAELAGIISNWKINNVSSVNFAIGGAFGNGKTIKKAAEKIIALGRFTWPHQMVRMMVAEQIYRIETILQGHPYHK